MKFIDHIKTLLRDHERAFIPGFGGFVKEYVPARVDRSRDLFLPPTCTLSFNPRLAKEDGLLAERIMEEEEKDFESAKDLIKGKANEWEKDLRERKRIELRGIGILYRDEEDKIRFEPDPDPELETSAYGLGAFHSPAVASSKEDALAGEASPVLTEEKAAEEELWDEERDPAPRKRWSPMKIAAVIVPLLFLLGFGALIKIKGPSESADLLKLLSNPPSKNKAYQPRSLGELKELRIAGAEPSSKKGSSKRSAPFSFRLFEGGPVYHVLSKEEFGTDKGQKNAHHFIVGGCFQVKANARARVEELSELGHPARILDRKRKGLHVVVFDSFADRRKALKSLRKVRRGMQDAWLLHWPS